MVGTASVDRSGVQQYKYVLGADRDIAIGLRRG